MSLEIPLGAMRFNSDSSKLEYWNGSAWMQIHTVSPNLAESGDAAAGVRAIVGGGAGPSGLPDEVQYFNMASSGNAADYGDLPERQYLTAGTSSRTRGIFMGGYKNSPSFTYTNSIQAVEVASIGYTSDFGDLSQSQAGYTGSIGNSTRGIRVGGTAPTNPGTNTIDYVTIAVKANAIDFGDLSGSCTNSNNINSQTRGVVQTNEAGTPNRTQLITIPTTGNAVTFGELQKQRLDGAGMSNSVRGIFIGGSPLPVPFMEYVTISSTGNGTRFGDLSIDTFREGGHASPVRGVVSGGMGPASPYPTLDTLQSVNFATEGDTVDFGDLSKGRYEHASISNGHGGLG